jgi:hypothetical protein
MNSHNLINATIHCPTCGEKIDALYTEDGTVEPLRYETVPLEAVRSFYGQCADCGTWLDFERRPDAPGTRPSDFTMTWDPDRQRSLSRRRFFTRLFPR